MPAELAHIWRWFGELHSGRHTGARDEAVNDSKTGGFLAFRSVPCPLPITYQDIDAWARITGRTIGPFELSILRLLDNTYFLALRNPDAGPIVPDPDEVGKRLTMGLRARALADKQSGVGSGR